MCTCRPDGGRWPYTNCTEDDVVVLPTLPLIPRSIPRRLSSSVSRRGLDDRDLLTRWVARFSSGSVVQLPGLELAGDGEAAWVRWLRSVLLTSPLSALLAPLAFPSPFAFPPAAFPLPAWSSPVPAVVTAMLAYSSSCLPTGTAAASLTPGGCNNRSFASSACMSIALTSAASATSSRCSSRNRWRSSSCSTPLSYADLCIASRYSPS